MDKILILDYGSQYTQLIARRIREQQVYSEIVPFDIAAEKLRAIGPKGIVLSGGPNSVFEEGAPGIDRGIFELGVPVLGVCYGMQLMSQELGGRVEPGAAREYGKTEMATQPDNVLFTGLPEKFVVWMSHGDRVSKIPDGFLVSATSANCPYAAIRNEAKRFYAIQFHPEVVHTEHGNQILGNFLFKICGCKAEWKLSAWIDDCIEKLRRQIGDEEVVLGLSGGVDSSVVAVLLHKAIGARLHCIFVDNGLLRYGEDRQVEEMFQTKLGLDRTDAGRTNPVIKAGTAVIDPGPSGTVSYTWTDCGIYSFTGRTDQATVRYFVPDPDVRSGAYPLTVAAAIEDGDLSASATCTTNFTVVKVDVAIAGVDEDKEETEGAFVQYVPDANGAISVEGTNKMVSVSFRCEPVLPTNEMVTVSCSGPAELYERLADGTLVRITTTNYPACEISSHVFKLHGHGVSAGVRDGVIRIDHDSSGAVDEAEYTVVDVDLRAMDLFGAVDDSTEHDVGAYVHWNIDNDDSSDNTIGAPKHPGGDYLQAGAGQVVGENDLKSLTSVISPALAEGTAVLRIDKDKAKLWKNAEKGGANLILAGAGERRWNLADGQERQQFYSICSSLFVDGVGNGEGNITLSYEAPSGGNDCSDTVKYTFISANCGRQPRTDITERSIIEGNFTGLVRCEWSITGGASKYYNCLAWAVGKTDVWVNDVVEINGVSLSEIVLNGVTYWGIDKKYGNGDGIRDIADIDSFFLAEANVVPTTSAKDATIIYYDGYHAARRMNCDCGSGCWQVFESKCGEIHRIEHVYDQLSGQYGAPARYYRPR